MLRELEFHSPVSVFSGLVELEGGSLRDCTLCVEGAGIPFPSECVVTWWSWRRFFLEVGSLSWKGLASCAAVLCVLRQLEFQ